MKPLEDTIKPFYLVDHSDGTYSICLNMANSYLPGYREELFMPRKKESLYGTGYDWASVTMLFVEEHMPELKGHISFDPEGALFCVYSRDKVALGKLASALKTLSMDDTRMQNYIAQISETNNYAALHSEWECSAQAQKKSPSSVEKKRGEVR